MTTPTQQIQSLIEKAFTDLQNAKNLVSELDEAQDYIKQLQDNIKEYKGFLACPSLPVEAFNDKELKALEAACLDGNEVLEANIKQEARKAIQQELESFLESLEEYQEIKEDCLKGLAKISGDSKFLFQQISEELGKFEQAKQEVKQHVAVVICQAPNAA